ncbi:hypothetical protein PybrP1_005235, partial [[Pythium] brassicae (nom. inval.)]
GIWGMGPLSKRLVEILQDNIRRSLPKVVQEIDTRTEGAKARLCLLGDATDCPLRQRNLYAKWVNAYLRFMESAIRGKEAQFQRAIERVEVFQKSDTTSIVLECTPHGIKCDRLPSMYLGETRWRPVKSPSRKELTRFIQASRGDELAIFPSYRVFCNLFRRSVDQWRAPALMLLRHYSTQTKLVSDRLCEELHAATRDEYRPYTQDKRLFQEDMEISLETYAEFAVRRFVDTVPIRLNDVMLVRFLREMEGELTVVSDEKLARLMIESPEKAAKRKQLEQELSCLKRAKEEIESLRYD